MKIAPYKFLPLTLVLALVTSACATAPPQIRPTNPDAFVGKWEGSWHSTTHGTSGPVEMTVQAPGGDGLLPAEFQYYVQGKPSPLFRGKWKLQNGELILVSVDPPCFTKLPISLHGDGTQQKHEWINTCSGSQGWSSLTRKK
jgi:hypothetical protein